MHLTPSRELASVNENPSALLSSDLFRVYQTVKKKKKINKYPEAASLVRIFVQRPNTAR